MALDPDRHTVPCVLRCSICGARSYVYKSRNTSSSASSRESAEERRLHHTCRTSKHWLSSVNLITPFFRYQLSHRRPPQGAARHEE